MVPPPERSRTVIDGPALVTFVGGLGDGPLAQQVEAVQVAIARDLVAAARASGAFAACYVVSDRPALHADPPPGARLVASDTPFHFGRQLAGLIAQEGLLRPVYVSRGGLPLLSPAGLAAIGDRLAAADSLVITNNPFSADLTAFTPGTALVGQPLPAIDNSLPRTLAAAGLPVEALPRDAISQLDVDTPADVMVLALHPLAGPRTRDAIDALRLPIATMRSAMAHFTRKESQVIVAGRVSSGVWAHLERDTACRVRLFAEERGMKADGREGTARSLFGLYVEAVGIDRAFSDLGQLGTAAFIDSRVLFAHLGLSLSTEDRFAADLALADRIADPIAAAITRAAANAPIPVVLGGHSLVAGGLYALIDAVWRERDAQRQLPGISEEPPLRS